MKPQPISCPCPETGKSTRLDVEPVGDSLALRVGTPLRPGISGSVYMTIANARKLANLLLEHAAILEDR